MSDTSELSVVHHDFSAKLRSVRDALSEPFEPEAASLAIEVVVLLREPMWRQAAWRDLDRDAMEAAEAAIRLRQEENASALLVYCAGVREALGQWRDVEPLIDRALALRATPQTRSEALLHLGAAAHNLGRYRRARSSFMRALKGPVTVSMRDRILQKLYRTERALGRLALAHRIVDDLIASVPARDAWFHAELLLDKASFVRMTSPHRALAAAERAREMYVSLHFSRGEAYADLEGARNLRLLGTWPEALERLSRAAAVFERTCYLPGLSHVRYEQARIALDRLNPAEAVRLAHESYRNAADASYFAAMLRATILECRAALRAVQAGAAAAASWRLIRLGIWATVASIGFRGLHGGRRGPLQ
jgi:tetratricopeptide (TPR) repeat protein